MEKIIRQILHRLRLLRWQLSGKQDEMDFFGEAALSIAGRWRGEKDPYFTYIPMFDVLRQAGFKGELLELGGGYSTVLAKAMFGSEVKVVSVDCYPRKYNRIVNSESNKKGFLRLIESVNDLTVTLSEAEDAIRETQVVLSGYPREGVAESLSKYVQSDQSDGIIEEILNVIFSESESALLELIQQHENYNGDLKFYQSKGAETGTGYCAKRKEAAESLQAVFFDCGEISSLGEWMLLKDRIEVSGYAIFHDIYYPKSIKNFLVCCMVELSDDWEFVYTDTITPQGGAVAVKKK